MKTTMRLMTLISILFSMQTLLLAVTFSDLTVSNLTSSSATVSFFTDSSVATSVNYGTDSGSLTTSQAFSISVTNVNESPTAVALSASAIIENASGATVGTLSSTDVDSGDTFTYTLSGTDASSFEISSTTLKLKDAVSANYESQTSYAVTVTTTDAGGLTTSQAFTISVANANEAPSALALSASSIAENAAGASVPLEVSFSSRRRAARTRGCARGAR